MIWFWVLNVWLCCWRSPLSWNLRYEHTRRQFSSHLVEYRHSLLLFSEVQPFTGSTRPPTRCQAVGTTRWRQRLPPRAYVLVTRLISKSQRFFSCQINSGQHKFNLSLSLGSSLKQKPLARCYPFIHVMEQTRRLKTQLDSSGVLAAPFHCPTFQIKCRKNPSDSSVHLEKKITLHLS